MATTSLFLGVASSLLLDFKPTDLGLNSTHQPTNYSVWRWSTTGGHNASMVLSNGSRGTQVDFGVGYCEYNASGGPGGVEGACTVRKASARPINFISRNTRSGSVSVMAGCTAAATLRISLANP